MGVGDSGIGKGGGEGREGGTLKYPTSKSEINSFIFYGMCICGLVKTILIHLNNVEIFNRL